MKLLFITIVVIVVLIFVIRLFGAWMLRIDDVIDALRKIIAYQKITIEELKKLQGGSTENSSKVG